MLLRILICFVKLLSQKASQRIVPIYNTSSHELGFNILFFTVCQGISGSSWISIISQDSSAPFLIYLIPSGEASLKEQDFLWESPARQNTPDLRTPVKNKRRNLQSCNWPPYFNQSSPVPARQL